MHKHIGDYMALLSLLALGVALFYANIGFPNRQFNVGIFLAMGYIGWGVLHHLRHNDFHLKVMVEYVLVSLIGLLILRGVLFY